MSSRRSSSSPSSQVSFSEEVKVRVVSLNDVDVSTTTNIVVYREEGFYLIGIDPTRIVEVEGKFGKRYFVVGKMFGKYTEADEAITAHQELVKNLSEIDGFDILYLPKRLLRELKKILTKVENGRIYLAIIHASGKGRNRAYTWVKKPHVGPTKFVVDEDDLQTALERLARFVTAGKNGEGGEKV